MPSAPPPRYESLDAWRGLACAVVVVFHSACGYVSSADAAGRVWAGRGSVGDWLLTAAGKMWVGVPLFFVISGYCIAASADAAARRPRPAAGFLRRRFWRIYPPLWIYLGLTAAAVWALPPAARPGPMPGLEEPLPAPGDLNAIQWAGTATLTEGWREHFGGPPQNFFTGQLWTLGYEEQFYLVVGLALLLPRRFLFPVLAAVTAAVAIATLDPAGLFRFLGGDPDRYRAAVRGLFADGLWLGFAAGVGVYVRTTHPSAVVRRGVDALLAVGLVWSWARVPSLREWGMTLPGVLAPACGFALLLGWLRPFDARLAVARPLAPFRFCGRMCYSLYLVHAPLVAVIAWNCYRAGITDPDRLFLVTVPLCAAVAVVSGYAFHRLVERPFAGAPAARTAIAAPSAAAPSRPSTRLPPPRPAPCT